jgi:hypothetical protein
MRLLAYFLILVVLLAGQTSLSMAQSPTLKLPSRPKNALTGSQFLSRIQKLNGAQREQAMLAEILRGNVPSHVRRLVPIETRVAQGPHRGKILRYWVLPDYLAVGSDRDYVRVPLNLVTVKKLAQRLNLSLPTTKMVDDIYAKAKVKLRPRPLPPRRDITSTRNIVKHERIVKKQLASVGAKPGVLVAGHKKDIVQSKRLLRKPRAIAIYGWHRRAYRPIQPLSTVHSAEYADYSHGVRLVANTVEIGSKKMPLSTALSQKNLAKLLSYEGTFTRAHSRRVAVR